MVQRLTLKVFVSHRVLWRFCVIITVKWQRPAHGAFSEFHVTDHCCCSNSHVHTIWFSHLLSRLWPQQSALKKLFLSARFGSCSLWGTRQNPLFYKTIWTLREGSRTSVQTTLFNTRSDRSKGLKRLKTKKKNNDAHSGCEAEDKYMQIIGSKCKSLIFDASNKFE